MFIGGKIVPGFGRTLPAAWRSPWPPDPFTRPVTVHWAVIWFSR